MRGRKYPSSVSLGVGSIIAALTLAASPASAQNEEIVVTASRYSGRYGGFEIPHVSLKKRPDYVVAELTVESDTRDLGTRRSELMQTLNDLGRRATANGPVSVALLEESEEKNGETRVKPFAVNLAEQAIHSSGRSDTSQVAILLRTAVAKDDTIEVVHQRFDTFVRALPKPGRVTLSLDDPELTLVNPSQYRKDVVTSIAQDAKMIIAAVGAGEAVEVEGLESPIAWRRTGDLELTIFLPYHLKVVPAGR